MPISIPAGANPLLTPLIAAWETIAHTPTTPAANRGYALEILAGLCYDAAVRWTTVDEALAWMAAYLQIFHLTPPASVRAQFAQAVTTHCPTTEGGAHE